MNGLIFQNFHKFDQLWLKFKKILENLVILLNVSFFFKGYLCSLLSNSLVTHPYQNQIGVLS